MYYQMHTVYSLFGWSRLFFKPYIDAKVAAALCIGGPIKYKLWENSNISKQWLYDNVVPRLKDFYEDASCHVAEVLALPLLYACMDDTLQARVPQAIRDRVRAGYAEIRTLEEGVNPVMKVPLTVYQINGQLFIDELQGNVDHGAQPVAGAQGAVGGFHQQQQTAINALTAQVHQLQQQMVANQQSYEAALGQLRVVYYYKEY